MPMDFRPAKNVLASLPTWGPRTIICLIGAGLREENALAWASGIADSSRAAMSLVVVRGSRPRWNAGFGLPYADAEIDRALANDRIVETDRLIRLCGDVTRQPEVVSVHSYAAALETIRARRPDLVVAGQRSTRCGGPNLNRLSRAVAGPFVVVS